MQPPFRFPEQFELYQFWLGKCRKRTMPDKTDMTAPELRSWLGDIHLIEVIEQGKDYRYLVFGTDIAHHHGVEMTRRFVSEWPEELRVAAFATYGLVVREKRPYLVRQNEFALERLFSNHRLVLPLSKDGTAVDHILTHLRMVPANREESGMHYHPLSPLPE